MLYKKLFKLPTLAVLMLAGAISGCDDAHIASRNLSKAADNFEVMRRVVFYNGITGEYILMVQGLCSVSNSGNTVSFTCKTDDGDYVKHMLGLSDNVTYFSEQLTGVDVSTHRYRVTFKPDAILPDIDVRTELLKSKDN